MERNEKGQFASGYKGGPGRPKGSLSGRGKLALELDKLFAKPKNRKKIREALQEYLDDQALKFYKEIAAPFMPKGELPVQISTDRDYGSINYNELPLEELDRIARELEIRIKKSGSGQIPEGEGANESD